MIQLRDVTKSYDEGRTTAVRGIELNAEAGEFLILVGASGCGKTTTLKMINRLIEPTSGSIMVDGRNVSNIDPVGLRRSIGYVFQGVGLFPHLSIGDNVAAIPNLLGWDKDRIENRVDELLTLVGLSPLEYRSRFAHELSGGQQQRVGVARALAASPKVMLMDEPFGALDPLTRDSLQNEFSRLHKKLGLTVVMVTHDMTEALLMADRIAVMHEGQILQVGTPHELMTRPNHDAVAALIETPKRHADRLENLARPDNSEHHGDDK